MDRHSLAATGSNGVMLNGFTSQQEKQEVQKLLTRQRSIARKSKEGAAKFSYKEVNAVLDNLVDDNSSPAMVQALLEHDADVDFSRRKSTSLFKRIFGMDQENRRSSLLKRAIENSSVDVVVLLASRADQVTKDEALLFAIQRNDAAKARALMSAHADAAGLHDEFRTALRLGQEGLVEALFHGPKIPCVGCRTEGLILAAETGSLRNASLLLSHGADADYHGAAALQSAIRIGRVDITNAIATCDKKPSRQSFEVALALGYDMFIHDPKRQHRILDICFRGGAQGTRTNDWLAQASKEGRTGLIELLVAHGASVSQGDGSAVVSAVVNGRPDLLARLVTGNPASSTLATALKTAVDLKDFGVAKEMTKILLQAGLRGDSVSKALVRAVARLTDADKGQKAQEPSLVQLLLEEGQADVNFATGKALQIASGAGSKKLLGVLLQYRPLPESLDAALPLAMQLQDAGHQLEIMDMIVRAGASQSAVSGALVTSAAKGKTMVALTLMLLKYSSVNNGNGKALCRAIKSGCIEQVEALMSGKPSSATVNSAWTEADKLEDIDFQERIFSILLVLGVDSMLLNQSLVTAARKGSRANKICYLLLRSHASPDYQGGACVEYAARAFNITILRLLGDAVSSRSVFDAAFSAVVRDEAWICPEGLETVKYLLEKGASGEVVDVAFCQAAKAFSADALELLLWSVNRDVAFTMALVEVTRAGKKWHSTDNEHLWLIASLLEWGASGEYVHLALIEAVEAFCQGQASEDLLNTLLSVGACADVNFNHGHAVRIAAQYGEIRLLEKLLAYGATTETVSGALAVAIQSGHNEDCLLSILNSLARNEAVPLDVNIVSEGFSYPIFACLFAYPHSAALAKRLCDLGCSLEVQVEFLTYDDEDLPEENVTVLAWALCQPQQLVPSDVINVLIEAQANPNFATPISRVTPLILAAKSSRADVVGNLLKAGALASARDTFDRTALFYASRVGDLQSVMHLRAKSPADDGSLHEAARELHPDVAIALIKAKHKHSPDFPSSKDEHQGRTALQELCLKCDGAKDNSRIETTIKALLDGKASLLERVRDKNALFFALDNPNPVPVTRALLDQAMWRHINDEQNVYVQVHPESKIRYYYSPTMYIHLKMCLSPLKEWGRLLTLLDDKRAIDRFYAEEGAEQPEFAVGQPPAIIATEKKRRAREEKLRQQEYDHELSLLQARQTAEQKGQIEQEKHELSLFQKKEEARQREEQRQRQHKLELIRAHEKTQQQQSHQQSLHELKMHFAAQDKAHRAAAEQRAADFKQAQAQKKAQIKLKAIEEERALKIQFDQRAHQQKVEQTKRQHELSSAANRQRLQTLKNQEKIRAAAEQRKLAVQERQQRMKLGF